MLQWQAWGRLFLFPSCPIFDLGLKGLPDDIPETRAGENCKPLSGGLCSCLLMCWMEQAAMELVQLPQLPLKVWAEVTNT